VNARAGCPSGHRPGRRADAQADQALDHAVTRCLTSFCARHGRRRGTARRCWLLRACSSRSSPRLIRVDGSICSIRASRGSCAGASVTSSGRRAQRRRAVLKTMRHAPMPNSVACATGRQSGAAAQRARLNLLRRATIVSGHARSRRGRAAAVEARPLSQRRRTVAVRRRRSSASAPDASS